MSQSNRLAAMESKLTPDQILSALSEYFGLALKEGTVQLSRSGGDGRNNSSKDEAKVSQALQLYAQANERFRKHGIRIELGPARYWYDFLVVSEEEGIWLPVNVKITAMVGQDNISSKEGLYYALTGRKPQGGELRTWPLFCESLARNLNPSSLADYYFFVVSKRDEGHVLWTSLKQLQCVVPNGNNPPFQANWARNQIRAQRDVHESALMLLEALGETFRLRAEAWQSYQQILLPEVKELRGRG